MSEAEFRNLLQYVLLCVTTFLLGAAAAIATQLADPGFAAVSWAPVLGAGITAVLAVVGGSRLPRVGSADLAEQVNHLKDHGVQKKDMAIVKTSDLPPTPYDGLRPLAGPASDVIDRSS